MMKGKSTTNPNPKSLVMLDATGKVATLKLTTSTGLHVYDGSMLWVNPAPSVTAAAPGSGQPGGGAALKPTKALPIVDPKTGEELEVKKPEQPPAPPAASSPPPPPTFTLPLGPAPGLSASVQAALQTAVPMVATSTPIFAQAAPSGPHKEQNIIDLLARATKTTPSALLSMSKPLVSAGMPGTRGGRGRGRDRDWEDRDQGRVKGSKGGKAAARAVQDGKGKGKGQDTKNRKPEAGRYSGDRFTKDAKYTASLDGRFWSLSCWPTGERDQDHRLTFGKHKLDVLDNGVVKVVLFGGVNKYKIRLHLCTDGDDVGINDKEGWGLATCEANAANLQLTDEASDLGWKIHKGEHPLLFPPGVPLPEGDAGAAAAKDEAKQEEKAADEKVDEKAAASAQS